jgi:hypothetical protein
MFHSYKTKGRWAPHGGPATEAFLRALSTEFQVEVTVGEPEAGLQTLFTLGLDGDAWLYTRDLEGPARFAWMLERN